MALAILAETPNAGRLNHRFLTTPGSGLDAERAAALTARFRSEGGAGADFVGVRRDVEQTSSGRPAAEVILLVGVAGALLDDGTRTAIETALKGRFADLGEVVAAADWADAAGLVRPAGELRGWIDPAWERLAAAGPAPAAKPAGRPARARGWRFVVPIAVLSVVGGVLVWGQVPAAKPAAKPAAGSAPDILPRLPLGNAPTPEKRLNDLIATWVRLEPRPPGRPPSDEDIRKDLRSTFSLDASADLAAGLEKDLSKLESKYAYVAVERDEQGQALAARMREAVPDTLFKGDTGQRVVTFRRRLRDLRHRVQDLRTALERIQDVELGDQKYLGWAFMARNVWPAAADPAPEEPPYVLVFSRTDAQMVVRLERFFEQSGLPPLFDGADEFTPRRSRLQPLNPKFGGHLDKIIGGVRADSAWGGSRHPAEGGKAKNAFIAFLEAVRAANAIAGAAR